MKDVLPMVSCAVVTEEIEQHACITSSIFCSSIDQSGEVLTTVSSG